MFAADVLTGGVGAGVRAGLVNAVQSAQGWTHAAATALHVTLAFHELVYMLILSWEAVILLTSN